MIGINSSGQVCRITLADYMVQGSIWSGVQALEPFPFFDTFSPQQLDLFLEEGFGNRFMFSKTITKPISEVAAGIVANYKTKWDSLIELLAEDFNIQASTSKTMSEKVAKNEKRNLKNDNTNKVSAFNTEELINNDGSASTGSDQLIGDNTRTVTEATISLNDAFKNLSLLNKSNILTVVLKDVASYLTLDVY